jgi:hypothetical protein
MGCLLLNTHLSLPLTVPLCQMRELEKLFLYLSFFNLLSDLFTLNLINLIVNLKFIYMKIYKRYFSSMSIILSQFVFK